MRLERVVHCRPRSLRPAPIGQCENRAARGRIEDRKSRDRLARVGGGRRHERREASCDPVGVRRVVARRVVPELPRAAAAVRMHDELECEGCGGGRQAENAAGRVEVAFDRVVVRGEADRRARPE